MKIVFIGAGMGALVASERLARKGFEVSVFEKKTYDSITYDWHDDINKDAFLAYDLPMPEEGTYFIKNNWSFLPPSEKVEITLNIPKEELDLSTERRPLAHQYIDRAKDIVDFRFGTEVESLIIEGEKVKGIVAGGKEIFADLVVDNSGAMSPFRASLPKSAGIEAMPAEDEIFVAYRGFHAMDKSVKAPENPNRAYLKHLGEKGISWSLIDPSGTVNVLIGRVGKLDDETFDRAYAALKKSNPEITDEVVRGGIRCIIPIRRPLTKMMTDGYAAIGDSAFMTIPMLGSGIESSMKAACMLADVIIKNNSCDKKVLWQYQREYYLKRGAEHIGVDLLKRWLLECAPENLDWLFEKGIVGANDIAGGATGGLMKLGFKDIVVKACKGISRLPLLLELSGVFNKCTKVTKIGKAIPEEYDEEEIVKWENKIKAFFEK